MNRAVFLDRDGVINEGRQDHIKNWGEFRFIHGSITAINKLSKSSYKIIIITNQSVVGRGTISLLQLEEIHSRMIAAIESAGGRIDAIYVCTHKPDDNCNCRKPKTLLIELAKDSFDIDLKNSFFVGDNTKDVACGAKAGCKTILVKTGYGGKDGLYKAKPDSTVKDLEAAVSLIIN